jgi:transcriptional regulator with XRE-family HTH domain
MATPARFKKRPPSRTYSPSAPDARLRFAKCLRRLRGQRGFTQRGFALALGIEQNRYGRYERAEVEPDLSLICQICRALDVMPNDLLGFDEQSVQ